MRKIEIIDPSVSRGEEPEKVSLLVTFVEKESHWGEFEVFRGTTWEKVVSVVSAEDLSHAMHGMLNPLLRSLGREPKSSIKRISKEEGECLHKNTCIGWKPHYCKPDGDNGKRGKHKLLGPPDCYEPPLQGASPEIMIVFSEVLKALKENSYIVVAKGKMFNLL